MSDVLTTREAAELIGVTYSTFSAYVSRGQAPPPDGHFKHVPFWKRDTIEEWHATRPGRGWRANR